MSYVWQRLLTNFKKHAPLVFALYSLSTGLLAQKPEIWLKAGAFLPTGCQLGEGAFWDTELQRFWFVDIESKRVHFFDWADQKVQTFPMPSRIGTLVPASKKAGFIAGLEDGIYAFDHSGRSEKKLCTPPGLAKGQRLNDGKCDPQGRFWVGGMAMERGAGFSSLFSFAPGEGCQIRLDSVSIGNGIVWDQEGTKLFYIDTPKRSIQSFDYNRLTGQISNARVLVQVPDSLGYPDGMAMDRQGRLWVAMWGGACVSVWSSKTGAWLGKVAVPVPHVTSCAFAGPTMNQLIITSAKQGLSPDQLKLYPESGNLFSVQVPFEGLQMPYWKPQD